MTKSASDGISFLFGGTSEHEYTQDEVVELCKKEQQMSTIIETLDESTARSGDQSHNGKRLVVDVTSSFNK